MGGFIFGSGGGSGGGPNLSGDDIAPEFVLKDKIFHNSEGQQQVGIILNWDGTVLSGPSSDGNKRTINPHPSQAYHIAAGKYLSREIEISAMPAGSAALARNNNVVTLNTQAGYIGEISASETVPAYSGVTELTPGVSDKLFSTSGKYVGNDLKVKGDANLVAGNIRSGATIFGIAGNYSGQIPATYSGATSITPSASKQYFRTGGYYVASDLIVYGDSYLKPANIKKNVTIFGVTGTYEASAATPLTRSMAISRLSTTQLRVYYSGANTIYSVGFIGSIASGTVLGGIARYGLSTCRGVFVDSAGLPQVGNNNITATWTYENQVDFTVTGYTFNTGTYTVFICYT